jgi:hypothetical protein
MFRTKYNLFDIISVSAATQLVAYRGDIGWLLLLIPLIILSVLGEELTS